MTKTRLVRIGTFLLFSTLTYLLLQSSIPVWWISLPCIVWAVCPPREYVLPRSQYRLARLIIALGIIAALTSFLARGIYEWDRSNWRWPTAILLILAALFASSRIRVWADLPRKQFSALEQIVQREAKWLEQRRMTVALTAPCLPFTNTQGVSNVVGLALSGGGIRSATVCLGVVTEFRRLGVFKYFDYLSTVSGGGWAGSAITAMYAAAKTSAKNVGPESWQSFYETFRARRNYLSAANLIRGVTVMVLGALSSFMALVFLMHALTVTAFWFSTFSMINWLSFNNWALDADEYIRNRIGPTWLYNAPRAQSLFELAWPVRLLPAFLLFAVAGLVVAVLLKLLAKVSRSHSLNRFAEQSLIITGRLVVFLAVIIGAFQGRTLVTTAAFGFITLMILNVFGQLNRKARWLLAFAAAAFAWSIDFIAPGWQMVERLTSYWYYTLLQLMLLSDNALQFLTTQAYIQGIYNGVAAPELNVADVTADSGITGLFVLLGSGLAAWLAFFLSGYLFQRNRTGLHSFWRNQIDKAFLSPFGNGVENAPLSQLQRADDSSVFDESDQNSSNSAPLHIVNASVNLPGSAENEWRHDGVARFEMSPYFTGGPATGWVETAAYGHRITLASAAAISAAAVNTQAGQKIPRTFSWLLLLANVSLGVWLANPRLGGDPRRFNRRLSFAPLDVLKELLGINSEEDSFVFVSDGGHGDNLGLVSLVERGCRLIVCVDAAADAGWQFSDLKYALSRLREGGWTIEIDDTAFLQPQVLEATTNLLVTDKPSRLFRLKNPSMNEAQTVVLLKSSMTEETVKAFSAQSLQYAEGHRKFPQESTADQWLSEAQFDGYYTVGVTLAQHFYSRYKDLLTA